MEKTTVSVLGCCVSRDVFGIVYPDKYDIECTLGAFSPLSMEIPRERNSHIMAMDDLDEVGMPNYYKRCFVLDYNKSAFSYLSKFQSDWLLLDIAHTRLDLMTLENIPEVVFTYNWRFKSEQFINAMGKMKFCKHPWDLTDEQLSACMNRYLDKVLKLYSQEKIVFLDVYCVDDYISKDGSIVEFSNGSTYGVLNAVVKKCSDLVKRRLPDCHWVSFPQNVVANENHKWGKMTLHYDMLYYEYAAKAFDLITEKRSHEQEKRELDALCTEYSERFAALRLRHLNATSKILNKTQNFLRWQQNTCDFLSELNFDFLGAQKFSRFTKSLAGKSIAILKAADKTGQILLKACENVGAKVIFKSRMPTLDKLTAAEFAKCKKADVIISGCVHGTKTHERDGVKCIDIWDILRDDSLTKDLPA